MTTTEAIKQLQTEHDLIANECDLDGSQFAPALLEALAMAIEVMQGKGDAISRQAAIDEIRRCRFVVDAIEKINGLPPAQSEREKGNWVQKRLNYDNDVWVRWECSRCGYLRKNGWKYILEAKKPEALFCEMCGADMRGEQE